MKTPSQVPAGMVNTGGFWERPVETMTFDSEPTANGDDAAVYMREWYEANREGWLDRHGPNAPANGAIIADDFILSMMSMALRIRAAADKARRVSE